MEETKPQLLLSLSSIGYWNFSRDFREVRIDGSLLYIADLGWKSTKTNRLEGVDAIMESWTAGPRCPLLKVKPRHNRPCTLLRSQRLPGIHRRGAASREVAGESGCRDEPERHRGIRCRIDGLDPE